MKLQEALEVAKSAAREAGELILKHYKRDVLIDIKSNNTPVTQADLESNQIIVTRLLAAFPEVAILSEELADSEARLNAEYCWIIDPLDGTKEFIKQNDEFAVNIALSYQERVVLGVVYVPVVDELYYAIEGCGAFLEHLVSGVRQTTQIHVSQREDRLRILKSRSHDNPTYMKLIDGKAHLVEDIRATGSSYKGCLIACGEADVYYSFGTTSVWDIAPLEIIITEAGGYIGQTDFTPFKYNQRHTNNPKGFVILNRKSNRLDTPCIK